MSSIMVFVLKDKMTGFTADRAVPLPSTDGGVGHLRAQGLKDEGITAPGLSHLCISTPSELSRPPPRQDPPESPVVALGYCPGTPGYLGHACLREGLFLQCSFPSRQQRRGRDEVYAPNHPVPHPPVSTGASPRHSYGLDATGLALITEPPKPPYPHL